MGADYHQWLTSRIKNGDFTVDFVEEVDLKQTAKQLIELLDEEGYIINDGDNILLADHTPDLQFLADVLKKLTHVRPISTKSP
jgi:DNA-directed RNA polymerase specialized sigma54-like protein